MQITVYTISLVRVAM